MTAGGSGARRRKRQRASYEGAAIQRSHSEAAAEKLLEAGLALLEVDAETGRRQRGDWRIVLLARLIRDQTTVGNQWIATRLGLKSAVNVSQQLSRVAKRIEKQKELRQIWKRLVEVSKVAS